MPSRLSKLDKKGRVTLPLAYLKDLGKGGLLLIEDGVEVPEHDVYNFLKITDSKPNAPSDFRQQLFSSRIFPLYPDEAGRIKLTDGQKRHAGIENECFVVKVEEERYIGIWGTGLWKKYLQSVGKYDVTGKF